MNEFQIPNSEDQSFYYNNKTGIIIKNDFQKNGNEKIIIYKNPNKKTKFIYGHKCPEIIINPNYTDDNLNQNYIINYRQCITNKELYRMKNLENEKNDESNENNKEMEESQNNELDSKMRYEYREEIISYRQINKNRNKYYYNRTEYNNNNNDENNNSFYYKTQKQPIKYIIYKKKNHKKNNTFVSLPNYNYKNNQKFKNSNKGNYKVNFPEEDVPIPVPTERPSQNSSDDENIKTFKMDIDNLNKYDINKITKSNNIFNKKFNTEFFANNKNKKNK